jgi:hypothetical protein
MCFPELADWGGALDEDDPPDSRPVEPPDRSPTKRQIEAGEQLGRILQEMGGESGALLGSVLKKAALSPTAAPPMSTSADAQASRRSNRRKKDATCLLFIRSPEQSFKKVNPSQAQRAAWQAVSARRDSLWRELLEKAFEAYQRQLPVRRKWWKVIYGDYLLDRRLPEIKTLRQFQRLIRPGLIEIEAPPDSGRPPAINLVLSATWAVDGMPVVLRDGKIAGDDADESRETIKHPTFGVLERIPSDDPMEYIREWEKPRAPGVSGFAKARRVATRPWNGVARFDPLLEFAWVAEDRAAYAHDRARADAPASQMAWEFANGQFELRVYAPAGQPPSEAQARAWKAFRAAEKRNAAEVIDTIFAQYQETCEVRRRNFKDRYVDDVIPIIKDPSGLRELIQLGCIHVHPADARGRVTIAFQFVASYDDDGISAMWREGSFREWGTWKDAEFRGLR